MKKISIIIISLILSISAFGDVVPKRGHSSIKPSYITQDGVKMIGYQFCIAGEGCSQIGNQEYYRIDDLKKQAKREKAHVILWGASTPFIAIVGLALGIRFSPDTPLCLLTGALGLAAPIAVADTQQNDIRVLMLKEGSNVLVANDFFMKVYVDALEKVLARVESRNEM